MPAVVPAPALRPCRVPRLAVPAGGAAAGPTRAGSAEGRGGPQGRRRGGDRGARGRGGGLPGRKPGDTWPATGPADGPAAGERGAHTSRRGPGVPGAARTARADLTAGELSRPAVTTGRRHEPPGPRLERTPVGRRRPTPGGGTSRRTAAGRRTPVPPPGCGGTARRAPADAGRYARRAWRR